MLRERFEVTMLEAEGMPPETLKRHIADTDPIGIVGMVNVPLTDEIMAAAPHLRVVANYAVGYNNVDLAAATRRGVLVTNTPGVLTEQTRHLIGERELRLMGPEHYLINAARGPIVDEKALVRALKEGWIKGAGLDVYEHEPKTEPGLTDCWNAVLLPHLGSATVTARAAMAETAAKNLIAAVEGQTPPNLVNPEALAVKR